MIDAPKKRQWLQFCLEINQVTSKIGNNKQTNLSTTIMETPKTGRIDAATDSFFLQCCK